MYDLALRIEALQFRERPLARTHSHPSWSSQGRAKVAFVDTRQAQYTGYMHWARNRGCTDESNHPGENHPWTDRYVDSSDFGPIADELKKTLCTLDVDRLHTTTIIQTSGNPMLKRGILFSL